MECTYVAEDVDYADLNSVVTSFLTNELSYPEEVLGVDVEAYLLILNRSKHRVFDIQDYVLLIKENDMPYVYCISYQQNKPNQIKYSESDMDAKILDRFILSEYIAELGMQYTNKKNAKKLRRC